MVDIVINMDPCTGCCAEALTCTGMEGRTKGGTATLCGFSEYTSPSTPPKKYRTQTLSGTLRYCQSQSPNNSDCSGNFTESNRDEYTGTFVYNSTTCATTNTQNRARYGRSSPGSACGAGETFQSNNACAENFTPNHFGHPSCFPASSTTATVTTWTGQGCGCTDTSFYEDTTGTVTATLSNEDTEADAIARAAFSWSAWSSVSGTPPAATLAKWESRGAGDFSLDYQEAEWRVAYTGKTAGNLYSIQVDYYRRTYGSGSYALYQTVTLYENADGSGNVTFSGTVPNAIGYETYAVCH